MSIRRCIHLGENVPLANGDVLCVIHLPGYYLASVSNPLQYETRRMRTNKRLIQATYNVEIL